jgi:hypothetical protein
VKDTSARPKLPDEIPLNWCESETDLRRREYYQQLTQRYEERLRRYEEATQFYTEVGSSILFWDLCFMHFTFLDSTNGIDEGFTLS